MLFSEPKIPQSAALRSGAPARRFQCSSASRKFLNRTNSAGVYHERIVSVLFSEPKIPQCCGIAVTGATQTRFSALQRAENSSTDARRILQYQQRRFQCSSASRKFLKPQVKHEIVNDLDVSVLFSEPKIPQLNITE